MELSAQAGPGVETAADRAVVSACHLADLAGPDGWSTAAAEDVLDAIDTLTEALGGVGEEVEQALAAVAAATADARQRLGITTETEPETTAAAVPTPRTGRRTRRRGLGPGFQGIRTAH